MRRKSLLLASIGGAATIAALVGLHIGWSPETPARAALAARPDSSQLPVAQVILYSSGVGYFQREGEVEGSTRIDLSFPVQDINDLLKSMVLQDLGGGHVSYDSQAPIDKTLRSFAIDLTTNPTFGQILNQARGEKVEVVLQQSNATQPGTLTGSLVGVEKQKQAAGKDSAVEVEMINLWCAEGMRSVKLADVQRLRFLNPIMDSEVKKALEVLALSHDTQKKAVSLSFSGEGKRPVRVGYVVENPIWKTSYRLVVGKDGKPFLQGWAVVENPTDEDWNSVRMALISGRPISFRMDLYQPLYIPRPLVEPELFASLRPPTYNAAMDGYRQNALPAATPVPGAAGFAGGLKKADEGRKDMAESLARTAGRNGAQNRAMFEAMNQDLQLGGKGIASAATATEMGDFFQYAIEHPVTLPRQKSAMLPIVNQNVEGTKVSIFNQATHPKFPLLGLKFKNTSGLHLMQGPITVFEGSSYAGDARILDLQPKEERLLSYAVDLGTEVETQVPNGVDRITKVRIDRGIIRTTHLSQQSKIYNIKNRSEHDRLVILEHPFRADFKFISEDKPSERARDVYRFEVPVAAGKSASRTITEEHSFAQAITLTNTDDQTIKIFLTTNGKLISEKVRDGINGAVDLKNKLALAQRELAQVNRQLNDIVQDQGRLRANLKEMPPTAEAYKRYLKKFDDQETEIEKLREQIKKYQDQELQHKKALDAYLMNLTVE